MVVNVSLQPIKVDDSPLVLLGVEERVTWIVIPIECAYVKVPRIRVHHSSWRGDGADGATEDSEREGQAASVVYVW